MYVTVDDMWRYIDHVLAAKHVNLISYVWASQRWEEREKSEKVKMKIYVLVVIEPANPPFATRRLKPFGYALTDKLLLKILHNDGIWIKSILINLTKLFANRHTDTI